MTFEKSVDRTFYCTAWRLGWLFAAALIWPAQAHAAESEMRSVTPEMFEQWMREISNWGRWGKDDELGTLNLITPLKRRKACIILGNRTAAPFGCPWRGPAMALLRPGCCTRMIPRTS